MFLIAGLAIQIDENLRLGAVGLGSVVSVYYLSAAVSSIPMSRLTDLVGSLRVMRAGCLAMAALLVALAALVHSVPELALVMVGSGMLSSGLQPATNQFLMRRIPPHRQGLAFGMKQAAIPVAVVLSGLSVPTIGLTVGWRWALVAATGLAAGTALFVPRPRTTLADHRSRQKAAALSRRDLAHLALLASGFGLGVASASALSAFTVTAAVSAGESDAAAGLLASLGGALAAGTRIAVGMHADRSRRGLLVLTSCMLGIGALAYVLLALSAASVGVLLIPGIVLAYSAGWGWNGLLNFAVSSTYSGQPARASGIASVGGRLGGMLGPFTFGVVATHASYAIAWLSVGVAALAGAIIIYTCHVVSGLRQ